MPLSPPNLLTNEMPAEILVETAHRTVLDYLLKPCATTFRES